MKTTKETFSLTVTANLLKVLNQGSGLTFTEIQLKEIAVGDSTTTSRFVVGGCIDSLTYSNNGQNLSEVCILRPRPAIGTPIHPVLCLREGNPASDSFRVVNLNDFRDEFQQAANFGHGVRVFGDGNGKMTELTLRPCACPCPGTKAPPLPASMDPLPGGTQSN